jgi:hypothetical protein
MEKPLENTKDIPITKIQLGPPGTVQYLMIVPKFGPEDKKSDERVNDKTPRKFQVSARFAIDSQPLPNIDINFNFDNDSGDSLFLFPESAAYIDIEIEEGKFTLFSNKNRRLSTARFNCIANSVGEAQQGFSEIIGPLLDHMVYITNTPLHIVQISAFDELHQISASNVFSPYPLATISHGIAKVSPVLAPIYAMYREAVNATSPFYKFFCFYKILEGLLKPLNAKLHQEAKQKSISLPPLNAKLPSYNNIPADQKPYVNKSIKRFFDEFLTTRYRNEMAHFISDEGAVLNVNKVGEKERYIGVIHISLLCCNELISHFENCVEILEKHVKQD